MSQIGSRRDMPHRSALVSIRADSRHPAEQMRLFGTGPALDRVQGTAFWRAVEQQNVVSQAAFSAE